jgi:hypothetical protein
MPGPLGHLNHTGDFDVSVGFDYAIEPPASRGAS